MLNLLKAVPKTAHATAAAPKTRLACPKYFQGQMQSAKKTMSQSTALFFPILICPSCILRWYGLEAQAHGEMNMHVFHLTIMSSLLFSLLMFWFSKMFSLNLDILPMTCFSNNNNKTTKEGKGYLIQGFLSEPMLIDNNYLSFSFLM